MPCSASAASGLRPAGRPCGHCRGQALFLPGGWACIQCGRPAAGPFPEPGVRPARRQPRRMLVTADEAAQLLRVQTETIHRWCRDGVVDPSDTMVEGDGAEKRRRVITVEAVNRLIARGGP